MSRANLAVQVPAVVGAQLTFSAPNGYGTGNGNTIQSSSKRLLLLINSTNTTLTPTVTVVGVGTVVEGVTIPSETFVLAAQSINCIWLNVDFYGSAGLVAIDITAAPGVTWAVLDVPGAYQ